MDQPDLFDVGEREPERSKRTCTPATIGSGPKGETCGTCKHMARVRYHDKFYLKCEVVRSHWTHGTASDIRAKWAACKFWEANTDEEREAQETYRTK